ncbi:MAG: TlpA disulfide reductase family protein [Termitinemataceae bacterium]
MKLPVFSFLSVLLLLSCGGNTKASPQADSVQNTSQSAVSGQEKTTQNQAITPLTPKSNTQTSWKEALQKAGFTVFPEPQTLPTIMVSDPTGKQIDIVNFRGSFVLLNFWATWCPPCRAEMPSMEQLYKTLQDEAFTIFAISTGEKPETVQNFLKANPHSFPIGLDPTGQLGAMFASRGIPTTYIIDTNGKAIGGAIGGRDWMNDQILEAFRLLLTTYPD